MNNTKGMNWHRRFFWLLLLFLPTQLGYHFWPEWAGVLGRRVDYLTPTVYLTDILVFLTLFFWLLGVISKIRNQKWKYLLLPCAVTLFVLINIYQASNIPVAVYKWLKVVEFVGLGWYIVRTKPALSTVVAPLSIGVLYSSILAIAQFVQQRSVGGALWWLGERTFTVDTPGIARMDLCHVSRVMCQEVLRPYATFPHPNVLGGHLAVLLPGIIQYTNNPIIQLSNKKKIFYLVTIILGIVALLLTFSRSAIIVGGVAIAVAIANIKYQRSKIKFILVVLIFVSLFSLFTFHFSLFTHNEESVVIRQQLNAAAINLWRSAPLFGVGLGNFLVRLPEALPTRTIYFLQPVHNIYLLLLSETGIVGIGLIVLWIAYRLNYEFRIRNYGKNTKKEIFIIHTSLFIILLLGLVDHYSLTLQQGQLLLTVLVAMSIAQLTK